MAENKEDMEAKEEEKEEAKVDNASGDEEEADMAKDSEDEDEAEMSEDSKDDEDEADMAEDSEDEEDEEEEEEYSIFSLPEGIDKGQLEELIGMSAETIEVDALVLAMYSKLTEMSAQNTTLAQFKADKEEEAKSLAILQFMKSLNERYKISEEDALRFQEEAKKYSLATIGEWETWCKAESFDFASKETKEEDFTKIAINDDTEVVAVKKHNYLW